MLQFLIPLGVAMYAIIGGPSVGKTAIIEELKKNGEIIVQESSTGYILEKQKEGILEPWQDESFDLILLHLYLSRVEKAKKQASLEGKTRIFTDRGVLDHFVYSEHLGRTEVPAYREIEKILNTFDFQTYYDAVFYIHPYNGIDFQVVKADFRREDTDDAKVIMHKIYNKYKETVPHMVEVPPHMTPSERAAFILNRVSL